MVLKYLVYATKYYFSWFWRLGSPMSRVWQGKFHSSLFSWLVGSCHVYSQDLFLTGMWKGKEEIKEREERRREEEGRGEESRGRKERGDKRRGERRGGKGRREEKRREEKRREEKRRGEKRRGEIFSSK
jgi:hypothetical protein